MESIKEIKETFVTILKKPEMQILPGQIAFYFMMSIIPIAAIGTIAASYITKNLSFMELINSVIPDAIANIIIVFSDNMKLDGVLFILVLYILVGSNAPGSIIIASNMLYGVKQPPYIKLKIKAAIMTIMLVMLILFVILVPLLGDVILRVAVEVINTDFLYQYTWIYQVVKVFISFFIIYFLIKMLYTFAPDKKIKSRTTTRGTLFTTVSWIIVTYIFSFYISHIANYNQVYGNFASILILLMWLYFLAYLFVVGMAINVDYYGKKSRWSENEQEEKPKQKKEREIKSSKKIKEKN